MKIKITALFIVVAVVAFGTLAQSTPKPATDVGISGFDYIRDLNKFRPENSKDLAVESRRALRFAKGILALRLEREIEGKFLVAAAAWGYQVNFSGLKAKKDGGWAEQAEGFGEVFLDKSLNRIVINYGP